MITFNTTTVIDDAEFDRNFEYSIAHMNNGTYPWEAYLQVTTNEEKKQHLRNMYDPTSDQNLVIEVRKDSVLVLLFLGQWHGDELVISAGLTYPDASGSMAWSYSEEYAAARDAYWDSIGINGWTQRTSGNHSAARNFGIVNSVHEVRLTDYNPVPAGMEEIAQVPEYQMADDILRKL